MNLLTISTIAVLGGWILIAILFLIYASLTRKVLERRYKEENDRGRKIEDYGGTTGGDKELERTTTKLSNDGHQLYPENYFGTEHPNITEHQTITPKAITPNTNNLDFEQEKAKWLS